MDASAFESRKLYLLLTRSLCRRDPLETLRAALHGGVDLVQLREKPFGGGDAEWIARAQACCAERDVPLIINDRKDLALRCRAAGLHLGQEDLAAYEPGSFAERPFALGVSTHAPADVERALLESPDYLAIGPCFATVTKGYAQGLGDAAIAELAAASPLPCFAIGGITAERVARLTALGIDRVAVSATILRAERPGHAAEALRAALGEAVREE